MNVSIKIDNRDKAQTEGYSEGFRAAIKTLGSILRLATTDENIPPDEVGDVFLEVEAWTGEKWVSALLKEISKADRTAFHISLDDRDENKRWVLRINVRREKKIWLSVDIVIYADTGMMDTAFERKV